MTGTTPHALIQRRPVATQERVAQPGCTHAVPEAHQTLDEGAPTAFHLAVSGLLPASSSVDRPVTSSPR